MTLSFQNQIYELRISVPIKHCMFNVDYVFHAAALKQVPSCEFYPIEAVKTNVLGTENVLNAAISNEIEKVISQMSETLILCSQ